MGTAAEQLANATSEELIEAFLAAVESIQERDRKIESQAEKIESQAKKNASQANKIEELQHQLAQLEKMIFGARSEKSRTLYPDHPTLFDVEPSEAELEVETEEVVQKRKKSAATKSMPSRKPLPSHLPRRKKIIEPEGLPEGAERIGEKVTEVLEVEPAKLWVLCVVRPTYRLPDGTIVTAEMPDRWKDRSQAGESLVAHVITSKFFDHLPTYR